MQSLEEDRNLLKQYRDTDTAVDPRAGVGAQIERARLTTLSSLIRHLFMPNRMVYTHYVPLQLCRHPKEPTAHVANYM